jgi:hypothetical protein
MKIGIVGLPNVGKSTLFNALLKKQVALVANYPFATVEPNVGMVDVPDDRLDMLVEMVQKEGGAPPGKVIPAVVKFVDIAGLVKGAAEGEGLGNQFLSHIREVDAIVHVLRDFEDENVARAGSVDPEHDREVVETELVLADIQMLDKRLEVERRNARVGDKESKKRLKVIEKLYGPMSGGQFATSVDLSKEEKILAKDLNLLTLKPIIYVHNILENKVGKGNTEFEGTNSIQLCAKLESELASLSDEEQKEYLGGYGLEISGLDKVIRLGYEVLGLQTFFTLRLPKEIRAWTVEVGTKAPQAAGVVHSDFEKGFISAEVILIEDLVAVGGWKKAKEKGKIRVEGKKYVVQDGDVILFRFSV